MDFGFKRILDTIYKKIFLLIARGGVTSIDNTKSDSQRIQMQGLDGETISDIERYQPYGFETNPIIANAESVTLFINGNRNANKAMSICINNRKHRPKDLNPGDVCIYCKDSLTGVTNRIIFRMSTDTILIEQRNGNKIEISPTGINLNSGVNGVARNGDSITVPFNVIQNPLWHVWFTALNALVPGYPGLGVGGSVAGSVNSGSATVKAG